MIRLYWQLNVLSSVEKRLLLGKSPQIFNDLNVCKVTEMTDILLTFTAIPRVSNISLENCGWLINEGGTRKKKSFFGISKYRCYTSQENFQTWLWENKCWNVSSIASRIWVFLSYCCTDKPLSYLRGKVLKGTMKMSLL